MTSPAFFTAPPRPSLSLLLPHRRCSHRLRLHPQSATASLPMFKASSHSFYALPSIPRPRPTIRAARPRLTSLSPCSLKAAVVDDPSVASSSSSGACATVSLDSVANDESAAAESKVGTRIRVKVPLKVYHIPKVPELELEGMTGVLKQFVGIWKGKRISANLPYKVEFVAKMEGRDAPVKFFAHLREDEFEYID